MLPVMLWRLLVAMELARRARVLTVEVGVGVFVLVDMGVEGSSMLDLRDMLPVPDLRSRGNERRLSS